MISKCLSLKFLRKLKVWKQVWLLNIFLLFLFSPVYVKQICKKNFLVNWSFSNLKRKFLVGFSKKVRIERTSLSGNLRFDSKWGGNFRWESVWNSLIIVLLKDVFKFYRLQLKFLKHLFCLISTDPSLRLLRFCVFKFKATFLWYFTFIRIVQKLSILTEFLHLLMNIFEL